MSTAPWKTFRFHIWNAEIVAWPWQTQGYQPNTYVGVPLPTSGNEDITWRQTYGESLLHSSLYDPNDGSERWSGSDIDDRAVWLAGAYTYQERELIAEIPHDPPAGFVHDTNAAPEITSIVWTEDNTQTLYPYRWRVAPITGEVIYRIEGTIDQLESLPLIPIEPTPKGTGIAPIIGGLLVLAPLMLLGGAGTIPASSAARRRRKA